MRIDLRRVANFAFGVIDFGFRFFGSLMRHGPGFFAGRHDVAVFRARLVFGVRLALMDALFDCVTKVFDRLLDFVRHRLSSLPGAGAPLTYTGLPRLTYCQRSTMSLARWPMRICALLSDVQRSSALSLVKAEMMIGPFFA